MTDDPLLELEDRLDPRELPHLARFVAAYLHEDFVPVHGSAARAAFQFAEDADLDEVAELAGDWRVLRAVAGRLPLERLNQLLRERFRSGWHVASRAEVDAVAHELERALRE